MNIPVMADVPQLSTDNLRAILVECGVSQRAMAKAIGIDNRDMRHYCAGRGIPWTVQLAIRYARRTILYGVCQ